MADQVISDCSGSVNLSSSINDPVRLKRSNEGAGRVQDSTRVWRQFWHCLSQDTAVLDVDKILELLARPADATGAGQQLIRERFTFNGLFVSGS